MQQNIEIEAKYILCMEDFKRMIKYFRLEKVKRIRQVNEYYDTTNRVVSGQKMMLRIRTIEDKHELTLKIPNKDSIIENNQYLSAFEYQRIKDTGIINGLLADYTQFEPVGVLTTYRLSIPYLDGELFFDENHYNDYVDYEIEYEVKDCLENAEKKLRDLLFQLGITNYNKSVSKFRRCCSK